MQMFNISLLTPFLSEYPYEILCMCSYCHLFPFPFPFLFPTWQINSMSTASIFASLSSKDGVASAGASFSGWSWVNEPVGITNKNAFRKFGLAEQINTTADQSDYLWYSLRYTNSLVSYLYSTWISLFSSPPVSSMKNKFLNYFFQHWRKRRRAFPSRWISGTFGH